MSINNISHARTDWKTPEFLRKAANDAINDGGYFTNQYTRSAGHPHLAETLSRMYQPLFSKELNMENFVITNGATRMLHCIVFCSRQRLQLFYYVFLP